MATPSVGVVGLVLLVHGLCYTAPFMLQRRTSYKEMSFIVGTFLLTGSLSSNNFFISASTHLDALKDSTSLLESVSS